MALPVVCARVPQLRTYLYCHFAYLFCVLLEQERSSKTVLLPAQEMGDGVKGGEGGEDMIRMDTPVKHHVIRIFVFSKNIWRAHTMKKIIK